MSLICVRHPKLKNNLWKICIIRYSEVREREKDDGYCFNFQLN
jgi:hypothetical protein